MERHELPLHEFFSKVWFHYVQAIIWGGMVAFSLILAMLFGCDLIRPANGAPGTTVCIMLCIAGAFFCMMFSLGVSGIRARRRPALRICREGLTFYFTKHSAIVRSLFVPGMIKLAWACISLSALRRQLYIMPWQFFASVQVVGLPMAKQLIVAGRAFPLGVGPILESVTFSEVTFVASLDRMADLIQAFAADPRVHEYLPSWEAAV